MSTKLSDYGMVGDTRTVALVSNIGSIDWLCLPDFDSGAIFCKVLDSDKGGFFSLSPLGSYLSSQIYKDRTNILKTDFFNYSGRVLLTDFMPISREIEAKNEISEFGPKIFRRVKAKEGEHRISLKIKVTPDFARGKVVVEKNPDSVVFRSESAKIVLNSSVNLKINITSENLLTAAFDLHQGEEAFFELSYLDNNSAVEKFEQHKLDQFYRDTREFWVWWAGLCRYQGLFQKEVQRSALTLKMLIFSPTGAVVAAPTTSLPEKLGGALNWDYRYVWLRDASFTMYALLGLGYLKEAADFMSWLEQVCLADEEDVQIMYGLRGEKDLKEQTLGHLNGYANSKPVRLGNGAYKQKQLDIYGEVMVVVNLFVESGGQLSDEMQDFVRKIINTCATRWREKDASIWEPRGGYQHFTYSKLMCWVGLDRGLKLADKLKFEAETEVWQKAKAEIDAELLKNGYNEDLGAFVQTYNSKTFDSSSFTIPILGFLEPGDSRVASNFDKTLERLNKDWFVYRTDDQADELKQGEGTFFLSTFWAIDNLSAAGRIKEAKIWLEKMIEISTPLGLYAEMYDPILKEHLGNFPQAFTHLGLINSVLNLNQAMKYGADKKATTPADRLKRISQIFNIDLSDSMELIIPSQIRENLSETERRRTRRHSFLGKIVQKIRQ